MTLQKIEFEYDIPDGYRFVRIGFPKRNELYVDSMGKVSPASCDYYTYWIIVEKIPEQHKRKHADLIHAWADGSEIQYYDICYGWRDICPSWNEDTKYRIKPKTKTVRFRNYLNENGNIKSWKHDSIPAMFVKWLGDWQEIEI